MFSQSQDHALYRVMPGDTLERIVVGFYGVQTSVQKQAFIQQIKRDNLDVINIHLIRPGQLLFLRGNYSPQRPSHEVLCRPEMKKMLGNISQSQWEVLHFITSLTEDRGKKTLLTAVKQTLTLINHLLGQHLKPFKEVLGHYLQYKEGLLTKGQYDSRRRATLDLAQKKMGNLVKKHVYKQKPLRQVIRVGRGGAAEMERTFRHLKDISSKLKVGGFVLTAIEIHGLCSKINAQTSRAAKNREFLGWAGSTIVGFGLGLVLMKTPSGIFVGAVLFTADAAMGGVTSQIFEHLYDTYGNKFDVVDYLGIDEVCRHVGR